MREDICSIPISELFEPRQGCPICRMERMLEQRLAEQRSVCRQKSRLYRSLGVFAGLFCAVLFC